MMTGRCPGCKRRRVLVRINHVTGEPEKGYFLRVREHGSCGAGLEPLEVRELSEQRVPVSRARFR